MCREITQRSPLRHLSDRCAVAVRRRHAGFAALEFVLVSTVVMLATALAVETAHWQLHAQVLQLAALEAVRAGSLDQARPQTIAMTFERTLSPLFMPAGRYGTPAARQQAQWQQQRRACDLAPWRIRIESPNTDTFADFQRPCGRHAARCLSRSDLTGQHRRNQARWGASGRGPRSGQTVFEANQLSLDICYLDTPLFPMIRSVLRQLAPLARSAELAQAWRCGLLPIRVSARMLMQTDTPAWPDSRPGTTMGKGWVLHD